jgi:hypothetical protein
MRFTFALSEAPFLWEWYGGLCEMDGFCLGWPRTSPRYERKTEFRRLSEILRVHLSNITRYPAQLEALVQSEDRW